MTWPTDRPGYPRDAERDSDGHVLRVDGKIDVYRWSAADVWFRDSKDRWCSPYDLVADGDEYLGQIINPADLDAAVQAERVRVIGACRAEMCRVRSMDHGPTPALDAALAQARREVWEKAREVARNVHPSAASATGEAHMRSYRDAIVHAISAAAGEEGK